MLNKIVIMGRCTKDPELRTTQSGTSVCTVNVAVDRDYARDGASAQGGSRRAPDAADLAGKQ